MKSFITSIVIVIVIVIASFMMQGCSNKGATEVDMSKPKFTPNKKLYPFESNYMTLKSGAKIHYVDEGEGDVLLLLHGNPTWSFLYRKMILDLKDNFRVIAPDYPGFGLSYASEDFGYTAKEQASEMQEFVAKMGLKDITLMVQDWGGPIGFSIASSQVDNVKAFIIGNTWAWPLQRIGHKAFSTVFGGYYGQFISWNHNGIVDFFMSEGVEKKLDKDVLEMYNAPFKNVQMRKQTHIFPSQLWDAEEFLKNVYGGLKTLSDKPVLIVWGVEDFAFQEPEREKFESIFTNHKTILLEGSSHFIQEDSPHTITDAIKKWYPTIKK